MQKFEVGKRIAWIIIVTFMLIPSCSTSNSQKHSNSSTKTTAKVCHNGFFISPRSERPRAKKPERIIIFISCQLGLGPLSTPKTNFGMSPVPSTLPPSPGVPGAKQDIRKLYCRKVRASLENGRPAENKLKINLAQFIRVGQLCPKGRRSIRPESFWRAPPTKQFCGAPRNCYWFSCRFGSE